MASRCNDLALLLSLVCVSLVCGVTSSAPRAMPAASWLVSRAQAQDRAAQAHALTDGIASDGLCGSVHGELPRCPRNVFAASASAGYGYIESVGGRPGSHQRAAGSAALAVVPLEGLALSLRFDGRYDVHPPDADGADTTMVGDPRLSLRFGKVVKQASLLAASAPAEVVSLGLAASLWIPGAHAPSLVVSATSLDLKLLASLQPLGSNLLFFGSFGFRLDNSANSAPDARRLRPGDRVSLALSDSNALLLVVGALLRPAPAWQLFCDLSADALLGAHAPHFRQSPLRASLGARRFLSNGVQVEASLTVGLSQRPSLAPLSPWVPIEPRMLASLGARFGRPRSSVTATSPRSNQAAVETVKPHGQAPPFAAEPPLVAAVVTQTLAGRVLDAEGAPLPEARVSLIGSGTTREVLTDALGRYEFPETPSGPVSLEIAAVGFVEQRLQIEVAPGLPAQDLALQPAASLTGVVRCVTRTFASDPLKTTVIVQAADGQEVTKGESDEHGRYEIQLPPGSYHVIITAVGYRPHRRTVSVSTNGVAILNVDMREL